MGTLTSCSFSAVNFRSSSIFHERVGVQVFESRELKRNLCFLCRGIISKEVSREKFFKIRCFSGGNNNDGDYTNNDGDIKENNNNNNNTSSSTESTVTTASPREEKEVEDKSTGNDLPPSVSSRVQRFATLFFAFLGHILLSLFKSYWYLLRI